MTPPTLRDMALRGEPIRGLHVIDGHVHLGPYPAFHQPLNDAASLVRTMDRIGIAQACLFSSLAIALDMRAGNDLTFAAAREFPDRFLPYAVPDPHRPQEVDAELRRCIAAGARGIKLHAGIAGYPFDGPAYHPAFALAHAHRLPLISHGTGTPDTLRRVARKYPDAHFIVAHGGSGGIGTTRAGALLVAAEEPNVYLDLTSSVGHYGAFPAVVAAVGARKLTYGSDMPWFCATHEIGRALLAPISEEDKRQILGGTLAGLLATRA